MFLKGVLLILLASFLSLSALLGQNSITSGSETVGEQIPTTPRSRVLDQIGLFDADREKKEVISARLEAVYNEHDLPVYLVLYSSLISGEVGNYPRDLYEAWIGEENDGVVAVIEVDSRRVDLAFPRSADGASKNRGLTLTRLPDHLLTPLIAAVKTESKDIKNRVDYVDGVTEVLVRELDLVLAGDGRDSGAGQFVTVTLLIGLAIGLLGYLCHRYTRRAEAQLNEQYFLPDVEVEPRLGAPYGGARVNTITFRAQREAGAGDDA